MRLVTRGTRRCIVVAEEIAAVGTGLDVVVADARTTRVTGNDVRCTVWLCVDGTRGLIGLAEHLITRSAVSSVILTDVFATSTAGFQMVGGEQTAAVNTFRCMVQTTDFVSVIGNDGVSRAKRVVTDGTDLVMLGANSVTSVGAGVLVVVANDAIAVRTIRHEVETVGFVALSARLDVRIAENVVMVCTPGLVSRAEDVPTRYARVAVVRAQGLLARITCLGMRIAGDRVTDGAFYPVGFTNIVTARGARFEMVSTERFVTQITLVSVSWASDIVTFGAGRGVISADDVITDTAVPAVSLANLLPARVTRS